jgi:hypothetical protein
VDISTIPEYDWYEWAKFRDTVSKFLVSKIQLGRDMGAAIDIGPTMTRKFLKMNGSVMYRSSVRLLNYARSRNPSCARTYTETSPSSQRATQLRSVLARVYSVSRQILNTTTVP